MFCFAICFVLFHFVVTVLFCFIVFLFYFYFALLFCFALFCFTCFLVLFGLVLLLFSFFVLNVQTPFKHLCWTLGLLTILCFWYTLHLQRNLRLQYENLSLPSNSMFSMQNFDSDDMICILNYYCN